MRFIRTFLFILTFCALAVPALAQSPNNGGLLIVVVDQQGAVVAGARVVVTNTATGVTRDSVSGPDGSAAISALPLDGSYTVAVSKSGFTADPVTEAVSAPGRVVAARVNKRITDSLLNINPNTKIFILGDLNDNPTSEGVVDVLEAKANKDDMDMNNIYNPWISMYKKGLGTESYHQEWNLIDQIMMSGSVIKNPNNKWKYYNCEIFNRDFLVYKIGGFCNILLILITLLAQEEEHIVIARTLICL